MFCLSTDQEFCTVQGGKNCAQVGCGQNPVTPHATSRHSIFLSFCFICFCFCYFFYLPELWRPVHSQFAPPLCECRLWEARRLMLATQMSLA